MIAMFIRTATLQDVQVISKIHARTWKSAYHTMVPQLYLDNISDDDWCDFFDKGIKSGTCNVLLAVVNEVVIGCLSYGNARDELLSGWGEIMTLYILEEHSSKGYGARLLNQALTYMASEGYTDIYLMVFKTNVPAIQFYERHGFIQEGTSCQFEILGHTLYDVRYVKKINAYK